MIDGFIFLFRKSYLLNDIVINAYIRFLGISLVVQWLRLSAFNARGVGLIPGWEIKAKEKEV